MEGVLLRIIIKRYLVQLCGRGQLVIARSPRIGRETLDHGWLKGLKSLDIK